MTSVNQQLNSTGDRWAETYMTVKLTEKEILEKNEAMRRDDKIVRVNLAMDVLDEVERQEQSLSSHKMKEPDYP